MGQKKALEDLLEVEDALQQGAAPDPRFRPHPLKGKQDGFHACSIDGNQWRLVYRIVDGGKTIELVCVGSHDDCYN